MQPTMSMLKKIWNSNPTRLIINLAVVYAAYFICRIAFLLENWSLYNDTLTFGGFLTICGGGFRFDSSAIFYSNCLFILLFILPLHLKEGVKWYQMTVKWIYVIINSLCVLINLADSVFFSFRLQRSTMATFTEFQGEGNLGKIGMIELASHWYFVLLAAVIIYGFWRLYRPSEKPEKPLWKYYVTNGITLLVIGFLAVCGMRGSILFLSATRPISVGYAQRFVSKPVETGIVLNTPFALLRTIGEVPMTEPEFFSEEELEAIYSPVHIPSDTTEVRKKNVVILIVESFAQEFIGGLNRDLDGGTYKGYTPFADSLLTVSAYWDQMFANAGFSIDAPPAVLASIPRMNRPFVTTPHSLDDINSIASVLKPMGYRSAFFHGADNESLGIQAFTRHAGFDEYYGQNEFYADPRFGGKAEFDGTWGVWDEPFLQYFANTLSEMPQPFVAAVFTLSSHHPFKVPDKYSNILKDEGIYPLHKCIRYTDYSLRRFFDTARKQPWYENTIFVLSADHASSKRTHDVYKNDVGGFRVPLLIFDPSGNLPRGKQGGIAQQTDLMPTLLNYIGNRQPYVAFGKDLFNTDASDTWAFNWDNIPQYIKGDYVIQLNDDCTEITGMYNYRTDPLLKENLKGRGLPEEKEMLRQAQAVVQSFMSRMNRNEVTMKNGK